MNDFLDAIKGDEDDSENQGDASKKRYDELKKEEADVDRKTPAEQRYDEIKEKAKQEMLEKEKKKDNQDDEDSEEEEFITY